MCVCESVCAWLTVPVVVCFHVCAAVLCKHFTCSLAPRCVMSEVTAEKCKHIGHFVQTDAVRGKDANAREAAYALCP